MGASAAAALSPSGALERVLIMASRQRYIGGVLAVIVWPGAGRRPGARPGAGGAGARHPRAGHHARHPRRHRPAQLHQGAQLHPAPRQPGEPAEDGGGRPRRRRSSSSTSARGRSPQAGYDKAYAQAVEKFDADPPADQGDRADADRPGAHGRRRAADRDVGPQGGASSASRTPTRSAPTWRASRSSTTAAAATCRSPTTATASSPTRTPASATASGCTTG